MLSMKRNMLLRLAALPFAVGMCVVPAVSGCGVAQDVACPEFTAEGNFGESLDIDVDVKTFMQAAGRLEILGEQMVADVGAACVDIATAAGRDPATWANLEGSELVEIACQEADAGVQAALAAAGNVSIEFLVEGGECKASLTATADCYAQCDVSGQCTPGQLEAQCEPGKLAGSCSGECTGSCEGGTIACQGECSATCTGSCAGSCIGRCDGTESSGQCAGECDGRCEGTCEGTCSGSCTYEAVQCQGTCQGQCSVEFQEPYCTGKFTPPECDIDAECRANCEASISAQAECTPPTVTYNVVGGGTAELIAVADALEKHLPTLILNGIERGQAIVDYGLTIQASAEKIIDKAETLSIKAGACAGVAASAVASASINIQVSVEASASVSGSASAGVQ
jgi:hypothetical protein